VAGRETGAVGYFDSWESRSSAADPRRCVLPEFILPAGSRKRALSLALTVLESLDEQTAWKVTIQPVKRQRSHSQNAYLWAVPYKLISEATGYEIEEIHEYMLGSAFGWKDKKVPKKPSNLTGVECVPLRTTTTDEHGKRSVLTTRQFADYIDFIQRFAAKKLGLVLPDPDPEYTRHER
jgi:hypothetical protein